MSAVRRLFCLPEADVAWEALLLEGSDTAQFLKSYGVTLPDRTLAAIHTETKGDLLALTLLARLRCRPGNPASGYRLSRFSAALAGDGGAALGHRAAGAAADLIRWHLFQKTKLKIGGCPETRGVRLWFKGDCSSGIDCRKKGRADLGSHEPGV